MRNSPMSSSSSSRLRPVAGIIVLGVAAWGVSSLHNHLTKKPTPDNRQSNAAPAIIDISSPAAVTYLSIFDAKLYVNGVEEENLSFAVESAINTTVFIPRDAVFSISPQGPPPDPGAPPQDIQRVIAANDSRITFTKATVGSPEHIQVMISVFCVQRWLPTPSNGDLSVEPPSALPGRSRDLVHCVEAQNGDHGAEQKAIWMVSDGLTDRSDDEFIQLTLDKTEKAFSSWSRDEIELMMKRDYAALPADVFSQSNDLSAEERTGIYRALRSQLKQTIREQIGSYLTEAKRLLAAWGQSDLTRGLQFRTTCRTRAKSANCS